MVRVAKASIQKEFSMMVQNLKDSQERTMERIKRKNENFYLHTKKNPAFSLERVVTMLRRAMAEKHVREAP